MDLNEAFQILTKNGYITISDKIELTKAEIEKASKEYAAYRKAAEQKIGAENGALVDDETGEYVVTTEPDVAFRAGVKWALKRINQKV